MAGLTRIIGENYERSISEVEEFFAKILEGKNFALYSYQHEKENPEEHALIRLERIPVYNGGFCNLLFRQPIFIKNSETDEWYIWDMWNTREINMRRQQDNNFDMTEKISEYFRLRRFHDITKVTTKERKYNELEFIGRRVYVPKEDISGVFIVAYKEIRERKWDKVKSERKKETKINGKTDCLFERIKRFVKK